MSAPAPEQPTVAAQLAEIVAILRSIAVMLERHDRRVETPEIRVDRIEPAAGLRDEIGRLTATITENTARCANITRQADDASAGACLASRPHPKASQADHREGRANG